MALQQGQDSAYTDEIRALGEIVLLDEMFREVVYCLDCQEAVLKADVLVLEDPDGDQYACPACAHKFCPRCGEDPSYVEHDEACRE